MEITNLKVLKRAGNGEKGSAVVNVLMLLIILTLIGLSATKMTLMEKQISNAEITYKRAFYIADSGISYALTLSNSDLPASNCAEITTNETEFKLFLHKGPDPCNTDPVFSAPYAVAGQSSSRFTVRSDSVPQSSLEPTVSIYSEIQLPTENKGAAEDVGHELSY